MKTAPARISALSRLNAIAERCAQAGKCAQCVSGRRRHQGLWKIVDDPALKGHIALLLN
jgi:hypothetical protein